MPFIVDWSSINKTEELGLSWMLCASQMNSCTLWKTQLLAIMLRVRRLMQLYYLCTENTS